MSDPSGLPDLGQSARATLMGAAVEAQRLGLATTEAEHLLLALAAEPLTPAGALLAEVGLDHAGTLAALKAERAHSLRAAGVDPAAAEHLRPTRLPITKARWGSTLRDVINRGAHLARSSGRRDPRAFRQLDLLAGLLDLEYGTVPRALAYAGIDRERLLSTARGPAS
ncbi:MAG: hypothetical protein IPJ61_07085 [Tessaracoccus sp.]|uniref:Clp protease N-terminal domain-containing protein n=1 Tax=Tessaracoccus sp. TaxID=1971211 RepID=UPI001ED6E377|nr:Clp protease N-terminal domain-containing protein [Tessaracoccus sp.]MBK7820837.1 hypothetical protein [Tessaracoccus sp.]